MDARERLSAKMQGYPDDVYLRQDPRAVAALPNEALALDFAGLVLGAPRAVDLESAPAVPALLLSARSERRSAELDWHRNAIVIASDIDRGEVFAGEAFPGDPTKAPGPAPRDTPPRMGRGPAQQSLSETDVLLAELGAGHTAGTVWLDFRKLLPLPAESRRWALHVIYFDEVSNPAFVEVRGKAASPHGISADDALKLVSRLRAAGQSNGLPRFYRSADTPQLQSPGLMATLGSSTIKTGMRPIPLHGVMRLEVSPHALVQSVFSGGAQRPAQTNPPSAILRGMVLVVMKDRNMPVRIPLEIPLWSDRSLKPGDLVEAAFSIDLADAMPKQPLPGTYQVYVIGGPYLAGPYPLTLASDK